MPVRMWLLLNRLEEPRATGYILLTWKRIAMKRLGPDGDLGSRSNNLIRTHHLVVFMFEDVAVPDISSRVADEWDKNASDRLGIHAHRVFPAHFVRIGRHRLAHVAKSVVVGVDRKSVV